MGDIYRPVFQESPERLLHFQILLCTIGGWFAGARPSRGEALKLIIMDCCSPYMVNDLGSFHLVGFGVFKV